MKIAPLGPVIHRVCSSCNLEQPADGPLDCPKCGARLVEVRGIADELLGTVICDRFEIRDRLGQGGMGTVYRAWQRSVRREVAIKLIEPSYGKDPMAVQRFEREAQLASQLSQPNTVSVIDFGQAENGRLFIAMELIRGRSLGTVLNTEGAFSIERAVRIGSQICDALEAAHELGIVHRDLKLDNVSVLDHPPGRDLVKVLDFGLAKQFGDRKKGTAVGIVVGTPRYMAPETAIEGITQPAGDVYALGVILAELVLGRALWEGNQLAELVSQKQHPAAAIVTVPLPLRAVIAAMIAPDATQRPTAAEARAQLLALVDLAPIAASVAPSTPVTETVARPRSRSRGVLLIGIAIGIVAAAIIMFVVTREEDELTAAPRAHRNGATPKPEPMQLPPDTLGAGIVDAATTTETPPVDAEHHRHGEDCATEVLDPHSGRCIEEYCRNHHLDAHCDQL